MPAHAHLPYQEEIRIDSTVVFVDPYEEADARVRRGWGGQLCPQLACFCPRSPTWASAQARLHLAPTDRRGAQEDTAGGGGPRERGQEQPAPPGEPGPPGIPPGRGQVHQPGSHVSNPPRGARAPRRTARAWASTSARRSRE